MKRTAAVLLFVLAGLTAALLALDAIHDIDTAFNAFWSPWRTQPLLTAFLWLTDLGAGAAVTGAAVVASGFLWVAGQRRVTGALWLTWLGAEVTTWSLKFLIARARPAFLDIATAASPSFPSGHATMSMAIYGFIACVLARQLTVHRLAIAGSAALIVILIGFSRIFLSLHYTSDVLAGFALGSFWLLVGVSIAGRRTNCSQ